MFDTSSSPGCYFEQLDGGLSISRWRLVEAEVFFPRLTHVKKVGRGYVILRTQSYRANLHVLLCVVISTEAHDA